MIIVYSWAEATDELKAFSTHGGDEEHVIVGFAHGDLDEIMKIRDEFDAVVKALDVWDLGEGTVHILKGEDGTSGIVYITAHA